MAKSRTLNEIRQSKEYQLDENKQFFMQAVRAQSKEYQQAKGHAEVALEEMRKANNKNPNVTTSNPFEHSEVEKTVDQIVENLDGHMYDLIFQAVCDEMNKHYVFDSSEYLTEAGLELFEDEWFEIYHENHGKIMHKLLQNLK